MATKGKKLTAQQRNEKLQKKLPKSATKNTGASTKGTGNLTRKTLFNFDAKPKVNQAVKNSIGWTTNLNNAGTNKSASNAIKEKMKNNPDFAPRKRNLVLKNKEVAETIRNNPKNRLGKGDKILFDRNAKRDSSYKRHDTRIKDSDGHGMNVTIKQKGFTVRTGS